MAEPLVSIIIPCFNARRYVSQAIQSALGQTYGNFEVIVVDDGSTDDSLQIIKSFGEAIRWESGPNRGGAAARNIGLALSKGEYVQFLDADDVLFPSKITCHLSSEMAYFPNTVTVSQGEAVLYSSDVVQCEFKFRSKNWASSVILDSIPPFCCPKGNLSMRSQNRSSGSDAGSG